MAALAFLVNPAFWGAAGAVAGVGSAVHSVVQSRDNKPPNIDEGPTAEPPAPDPGDSQMAAKEEAARKRRIQALSGGNTLLTSPLGAAPGSGTAKQKSLLGA